MYFKQSNLEKDEMREGEREGAEGRGQARGGGRRNTLRKASHCWPPESQLGFHLLSSSG